tara:strand:+ start:4311 stop:4736 length:426 start_codon:yes stop_codon:yes gene_type:complete
MKNMYNPNQYTDGVNVFVSINRSYDRDGHFEGRTLVSVIARCWVFSKTEIKAIQKAFQEGKVVTVSGVYNKDKKATYRASAFNFLEGGREDSATEDGWGFTLEERIFEGAPLWNGSVGARAVKVYDNKQATNKLTPKVSPI